MPRSTTAPAGRGCAPSTPSMPPPTAGATPSGPSTPPGRSPSAPRRPWRCGRRPTPSPPSSPVAPGPRAASCWWTANPSGSCRDPAYIEITSPALVGITSPREDVMSTLELDPALVGRARALAVRAAAPVVDLARRHTTVSVERAVLRLAGLTGTDPVTGEGAGMGGGPIDRVPWVNRVVDAVRDQVGLESGVALPVWHALASGSSADLQQLAEQVGAGTARFELPAGADAERARDAARAAVDAGLGRVDANRRGRDELVATH